MKNCQSSLLNLLSCFLEIALWKVYELFHGVLEFSLVLWYCRLTRKVVLWKIKLSWPILFWNLMEMPRPFATTTLLVSYVITTKYHLIASHLWVFISDESVSGFQYRYDDDRILTKYCDINTKTLHQHTMYTWCIDHSDRK